MTARVLDFPARGRVASAADRDLVTVAMVDVLAAMTRHSLDLAGDVQVLATLLGYVSRAHGVEPDMIAFAAVSSVAVDGVRH